MNFSNSCRNNAYVYSVHSNSLLLLFTVLTTWYSILNFKAIHFLGTNLGLAIFGFSQSILKLLGGNAIREMRSLDSYFLEI